MNHFSRKLLLKNYLSRSVEIKKEIKTMCIFFYITGDRLGGWVVWV
jgi:hypothetical protein